jgi:hypothetical protein
MFFRWYQLAASLVLALASAAQAADFSLAGPVTYRCTNPASSANWNIEIDFDRHVADSYPAQISESEIAWHNSDDAGNYSLDRATGRLTVIRTSSTGGYMIFDVCAPGR